LDSIISFLTEIDVVYVYTAVFLISYIENIFPPFPSDVIVVFAGSLVAMEAGSAVMTVFLATTGSTLGFMSMYWIGDLTGDKWLETGKIKFISIDLLHKVESWFQKYGYWVVIANRFLAGTRAVVSFCAGMSEMKLAPTTALSAVSAMLWNSLLVYLGLLLGSNWREIGEYLSTYSKIASILIAVVILVFVLRAYLTGRKKSS